MADEPHVIRGINWRETFPFTHIFRAFRIAIHPSKLVLALLALLTLYTGGRVLDGLWSNQHRAVPGEIEAYEDGQDMRAFRENARTTAAHAYARELQTIYDRKEGGDYAALRDYQTALTAAREGKHTGHVEYRIRADRDAQLAAAQADYDKADKSTDAAGTPPSGTSASGARRSFRRPQTVTSRSRRSRGRGSSPRSSSTRPTASTT